ncbi:MAG: sulfatase family protein [Nonlabens sp.]|uniref:sulfatase family protein n=1 Tax=Nonlabens sp. TaxID=1888209 RepID=UPI003EF273A6
MKKILFLLAIATVIASCNSTSKTTSNTNTNSSSSSQPNILWIVTEDISPMFSFYGDKTAKTPVLDALAKESVVYDNAFAVVGVCGPSRSAIITGMYPTSIGTMHMRTGQDVMAYGRRTYQKDINRADLQGNDIIQYAAVIPEYVKCFPEYLRQAGYFTSNNEKTDYQFAAPVTVWDQNSKKAHWRNRKDGQPFFSVFNYGVTHESRVWKNADLPLTVNPKDVKVPPYFQDTETSRTDIARVYSNIELLDKQVGDLLQQLKDDGLYDNTIIFFYSDHGGPLPRQKREIYDSGLKVPFMVKDLRGKSGRSDQLVSFIDLAPTVLNLANVKIPENIQGTPFMGTQNTEEREYIFGSSDRFDEFTDRSRAVRNDRYLYIQNDLPEKIWYKDVGYRKQVPMMEEMLRFRESGTLNSTQQEWFTDKTSVELYDCKKDPHNLVNLAGNEKYNNVEKELRQALLNHRDKYMDYGMMPEAQLINQMWPNFEQPITDSVKVIYEPETGKLINLESATQGASIGYILSDKPVQKLDLNSNWQVFGDAIPVQKGQYLYAMAQRIGYKESEILSTIIE